MNILPSVQHWNDLRQKYCQNFMLSQQGFWQSQVNSKISYPDDGNDKYFKIEDESFWFSHRRKLILAVMKLFPPPGEIVDVGGGNGYMTKALVDAGYLAILAEPGFGGCKNGLKRSLPMIIQGSFPFEGLSHNTVPAIGLFDVLEHLPNDDQFLKQLHTSLSDNGRLYLTVPSFQCLWSQEDIDAGHFRRYTMRTLSDVLDKSGFEIEFSSYFFSLLIVPIFIFRRLIFMLGIQFHASQKSIDATHKSSGHRLINPELFLSWELWLINKARKIPIGSSLIAVARKRK